MNRRTTDPDAIAARATGVGAGLVALMLTWLVGFRAVSPFVAPPWGPTAALVLAILVGAAVAHRAGRRCVASVLGADGRAQLSRDCDRVSRRRVRSR